MTFRLQTCDIKLACLVVCILFCSAICSAQGMGAVTLWNRNFDSAPVDKILALALLKTEDLYPVVSIRRSVSIEYHQAIASLESGDGKVSIMNTASSVENDRKFYTIRFPVLKGLLGRRICLIRKGDQARFAHLRTIHDFSSKKVKVCQGADWPDTQILRRNGLPLATSTSYFKLFDKLHSGECDCFLRGAQEIVPEYRSRLSLFEIESSLLISYLEPGFFYVNRNNPELATRVELGLLRALDDGSYEKLFDELMGDNIEYLNLGNRHSIRLVNTQPSMISQSLQSIISLWYP